ncbi:uncharacterized protein [Panulirus ornatus]|uniref:uncharacterized protein n=1 Tax=Panulirus ornatus TaxID=150431 RepID=UPI003A88C0D6
MRQILNLRVVVLVVVALVTMVVGAPQDTYDDATPKLLVHKKLWLLRKKQAAGNSAPHPPTSTVTVKVPDLLIYLPPTPHRPLTTPYLPATPSYTHSPALPSMSSDSSYTSSPPHLQPSSSSSGGCVVGRVGGSPGHLLKEGMTEDLGHGVCGVRRCARYNDKFVMEEEKCNLKLHNPNYTCLQFEDLQQPFPLCCPRLDCRD